MTIEADLYSLLTQSTSIAALSSNRTYPVNLPQDVTFPAISYMRISTVRESCMGHDAANVAARFQVDCWDDDPLGARALSEAVRGAVQRYGSTSGSVVIETIFIEEQQEIPERDVDENIYRVSIDLMVHYKE